VDKKTAEIEPEDLPQYFPRMIITDRGNENIYFQHDGRNYFCKIHGLAWAEIRDAIRPIVQEWFTWQCRDSSRPFYACYFPLAGMPPGIFADVPAGYERLFPERISCGQTVDEVTQKIIAHAYSAPIARLF
jgi:hypothetical protein